MATKQAKRPQHPSLIVIFGDEEYQKQRRLHAALDALLPPEVDRAMALSEYDGTASEEQGGPVYAAIADDLATLPFLADRRVVVIREADRFITSCREKLERWVAAPPPTGTLILECRSFPKNTRLYKAGAAAGAALHECKKLYGRALSDFVVDLARQQGKQLEHPAAGALVDLVGQDQGQLAGEIEKLCLFVGERQRITREDVTTLVGQSREEKIFAALDAAGVGRSAEALRRWHDVLATDRDAIYKAIGGMAFKLRQWLTAQEMAAGGLSPRDVAQRMRMFGRNEELAQILRRLPPERLCRLLAALAELDAQAKTGARSIETGIEGVLVEAAGPAA